MHRFQRIIALVVGYHDLAVPDGEHLGTSFAYPQSLLSPQA
ncbi:hypothetical protein [Methanoregula sp.]|nr:hypothetical protein [Methanoregula sp.]